MKLYEAVERAIVDGSLVIQYIDGSKYKLKDCCGEIILKRTEPVNLKVPIGFMVTKWKTGSMTSLDIDDVRPSAWAMLFNGWEVITEVPAANHPRTD